MQLPSLQRLATEAVRVVRRFPLTLCCSLLLGAVAIYYQRLDYKEKAVLDWLFPTLSAAALGLPLTLSVALAGERYSWTRLGRVLVAAGAVALLGLWYWLCPTDPTIIWASRLALLLLGLHLLVAVVPYLPELRREADTPGFWRYNETLFLRILTGGLYSGVLFAGCALALVAVENLFDIKLDRHIYEHLFTVMATVFNTWFFLAGVPHDWAALEQETAYPKGLKLFTQFVLLPLVVLYLGILYAYLARIVVLWTLPKGWVSTLILAFSVAGIFALLLIHPIRNAAENTWIRTFARWFYRALFPLLALLFVAIGTRVQAYGITEERYFVLVLAVWLGVIAAYFLWRQGRGIIWIPASLAAVAFVASAGPLSAFAVSERSQLNQLVELTAQYKLLQNGKLDGASQRVPNLPETVHTRLSSIFYYFTQREAAHQLQPLFAASLALPDSLNDADNWTRRHWAANRIEQVSGIASTNSAVTEAVAIRSANFQHEEDKVWPLGNGRYWLNNIESSMYNPPAEEVATTFNILEGTYRLLAQHYGRQLLLQQLRTDSSWQTRLTLTPGATADSLVRVYGTNPERSIELPAKGLTLHAATDGIQLHLYLRNLNREQSKDGAVYYINAQALLELREKTK
ncbi:DUF4153 domain-containing protein [Hymenobacter sediminicola]|uniref:DUF4153 domain-containing protein n=1 Tax=Hymenobacter sediminicola TaxID=2761579 RepID=A0A7G7W394_9BACT|nr:DUF4153 domain-containing protein [Hymenobacter sediminicola]QNH60837.1 DUF4153 domain-containing protein [Hymenobacter sediminicola]